LPTRAILIKLQVYLAAEAASRGDPYVDTGQYTFESIGAEHSTSFHTQKKGSSPISGE
jgi:hypothetical protein